MTLINALLQRRDPLDSRAITNQSMSWFARGDDDPSSSETVAGVQVNRSTALGLSAVWACVSLIGDSIATLPTDTVTEDELGVRSKYRPRPKWLETPNSEQTKVDFIFAQIASLLLDGTAFVYTSRDRKGDVSEAWVLDPNWVQVRREPKSDGSGALELVYYVGVGKGQQSPVGAPDVYRVPAGAEMFHIRGFTSSSGYPRGLPPLEIARMMYGGGIASQEMGARFFGSGMNASGVVEVPGDLMPDQARELKRDFKQRNGGLRNMHLPPVLTGGATFKQISISPEQSQFLQHREFTVDEIARWFRVPPHMIGHLVKSTSWGTGIEFQGMTFVNYTLRPWIERLEAAWTRSMLLFEPGVKVRFDVSGLLRGDHKTRGDYYMARFQTASITPNQIAISEGDPPIGPDGDKFYYPANMVPVGEELGVLEPSPGSVSPQDSVKA